MRKNIIELINFVLSKKYKKEKIKYFFKLFIYFIPILFSLKNSEKKFDASASQAGDDIYPIF